jgi:hypothetical protein
MLCGDDEERDRPNRILRDSHDIKANCELRVITLGELTSSLLIAC